MVCGQALLNWLDPSQSTAPPISLGEVVPVTLSRCSGQIVAVGQMRGQLGPHSTGEVCFEDGDQIATGGVGEVRPQGFFGIEQLIPAGPSGWLGLSRTQLSCGAPVCATSSQP